MFYIADDDDDDDEKLLLDTSIMILLRHSPLYALVCLYFDQWNRRCPRPGVCQASGLRSIYWQAECEHPQNLLDHLSIGLGFTGSGLGYVSDWKKELLIQVISIRAYLGMPSHMASFVQIASKAGSRLV
jgi:hypothetical protein